MDRAGVASMLKSTGLQLVYKVWPAEMDGIIPYPHLRYWRDRTVRFKADGMSYLLIDEYEVLLVSEEKDEASEAAVEAAFEAAGIVASDADETWVADERLFQVSWNFQTIRNDVPETGDTGATGA